MLVILIITPKRILSEIDIDKILLCDKSNPFVMSIIMRIGLMLMKIYQKKEK
jgi:hypothetical protein